MVAHSLPFGTLALGALPRGHGVGTQSRCQSKSRWSPLSPLHSHCPPLPAGAESPYLPRELCCLSWSGFGCLLPNPSLWGQLPVQRLSRAPASPCAPGQRGGGGRRLSQQPVTAQHVFPGVVPRAHREGVGPEEGYGVPSSPARGCAHRLPCGGGGGGD